MVFIVIGAFSVVVPYQSAYGAVRVGTEVSSVGNNYNVKVTADTRDADVSNKLFIGTDQWITVPSALVPYFQFTGYNAPSQQNDFFGDFQDGTIDFSGFNSGSQYAWISRAIASFDNLPAPQNRKAELGTLTFNAPNGLPAGTYNFNITVSKFNELNDFLNGNYSSYRLENGNVINDYNQQFFISPADMNCDNVVNNQDIAPFVLGLTQGLSSLGYPSSVTPWRGDMNYDGVVNNQDIAPFVTALVGSGSSLEDLAGLSYSTPSVGNYSSTSSTIPEPSTLGLLAIGAGGALAYSGRRRKATKRE